MALLIVLAFVAQFAQADAGELRIAAVDATGGVLPGVAVTVESDASQTRRGFVTDAGGRAVVARLPFGSYRVTLALSGFTTDTGLVDIKSAAPTEYRVTMSVAGLTISDRVALPRLDARQTMTVQRLGAETIQRRAAAVPGRALPELINTQPGWLLEAGGTVHPRGSENQTQYVVDGLPLTDNRSPGFAPAIEADAVQSLGIMTGGYPAEYGRKLGGVVEVATIGDPARGFHGDAATGVGSFTTLASDGAAGYARDGGSIVAVAGGSTTDRYLDPPVEENYSNHGRMGQAGAHLQRRGFGAMVSHARTTFQVPNEVAQEAAGQRQERTSGETSAKLSYQRAVSSASLFAVNGMARDLDAGLTSNEAATPIFAAQQRGLREGYVKATFAWTAGAHEWKAGGDTSIGRLREQFAYHITDASAFAPGILPSFVFAGRATDREHALFVQDRISSRRWTVKAGLRWDAYHLLVNESALSPRLAIAWSPDPKLALRASYDRAFQTPAVENLLLASSPAVETLAPAVVRLPVRPSRGNFYEAAATALVDAARLDVSWFARRVADFADDDLLLNTGVGFPIAFRRGIVHGAEVKLDLPPSARVSGSISYSWMRGEAELPVTGGLFLGEETDLGTPGERVTITQDQRHTARGRISAQLRRGTWIALAAAFDSGLPFEDAGDQASLDQMPAPVLSRVNLETGRVRPAFTLDASAGWTMARRGRAKIALQADARNLTNELRVINFAGVFSGTALAAPRTFAARLRVEF